MAFASTVNKGAVKPMIHVNRNNKPMRMNMARNKPILRACSRCAAGNLSTRMEMKMTLSMPSTSSSAVSVAKAIQAAGEERSSITGLPACQGNRCVLRARMGGRMRELTAGDKLYLSHCVKSELRGQSARPAFVTFLF